MQVAFSDSATDDAFTRSGGRCECTQSSHAVIRPHGARHPARVKAATPTSARPDTWWEHLRERASNGRIPGEPIMAREPEFEILKNTDGEYYWHLEAAGSRVAAWSGQAYAIKQACVDDLYWVKDNASQIMIYDYTGE
jgi:uncharacterized protein YegP (UPF0339 family)/ribosomal protein S14